MRLLPLLLLPLLLTACGPTDATHTSPSSVSPDATHDAHEATLTLDADTFSLAVVACDLKGETDEDAPTLHAEKEAPGGTLTVVATRERLRGSLIHRIQVTLDGGGEPFIHEAERTYGLGAWTSLRDGPEEPLLHISGDTLRAEGRFGEPHPNEREGLMDGKLEAICL